ncbi:MAG: glycosyltransferase [Pseudomonadota bacterium]|nr:glycosyltransferase [Pseudomonadota bacterium]
MFNFSPKNDAVIALSMNAGYTAQARQVLAGLHHHARWRGDYLLLCHDVPQQELEWFSSRGVHIEHVPELFCNDHLPAVTFSRYVLFRESVRACWRTVIFLDLDILVRGEISALTRLNRIGAVRGYKSTIRLNFVREKGPELYARLDREFDLDLPAFNGGVMAFPTAMIAPDTFDRLCELTEQYLPISRFANQGLLNLLFRGCWTELSPIYNAYVPTYIDRAGKLLRQDARIIHFNGRDMKPWDASSVSYPQFSAEWSANLRAAEDIAYFSQCEDATEPEPEPEPERAAECPMG